MNAGRLLVTGAGGMLGQDLMSTAREALPGAEVVALDRQGLDITSLDAVIAAVRHARPWGVINCAAYADVDRAETAIDAAMSVNGLGPRNLAVACQDAGAWLMHFSTDYVFDGTKPTPYAVNDRPNPINQYGRTKLAGEQHVTALCLQHFIVRTSWLFGPHGRNFVRTMLHLGKGDTPLRVVTDQTGAPTYTADLARAAVALLQTGAFGTYHITNSGLTTWHGFAVEIMRQAGLAKEVLPVSSDEFPRPARRPRNSALDPFPLKETIGQLLPAWQDALSRYLKEELHASATR